MTEHEQNLRDLAAMFAMCGLIIAKDEDVVNTAFKHADYFMENRLKSEGISAIKKKKKDVPQQ